MAMTVRLPSELDEALESKTERVLSAVNEIGRQYEDALRQLGDA